jgi:RNA polymerase primary sigma factor
MGRSAGSTGQQDDRSLDTPARSARDAVRGGRVLRAAQRGDPRSREQLVALHLGLVRSVASRYRGLGLPFDDLVQEGSLGLLEAIDRYDARHGTPFDSYARFRVRRAIRNALTDQTRLIRLPKQIVQRRRAIDDAEARLVAETDGCPPTPAELAAATGMSVGAVLNARFAGLAPVSLDEPVLPDGSSLASVVADPSAADPELKALEHEQSDLLEAALESLPKRQRYIVNHRWGIGGAPMSITDLAAELELSTRRTQTIGRDALYELRAALEPREARAAGSGGH